MLRFRRTRKEQAPTLHLVPESHAGQHGYTVYEGSRRIAWGRTQDAALACAAISRSA